MLRPCIVGLFVDKSFNVEIPTQRQGKYVTGRIVQLLGFFLVKLLVITCTVTLT